MRIPAHGMMSSTAKRYGAAVVTLALAAGIIPAVASFAGQESAFVVLLVAVSATAWLAGQGPGILSTFLAGAIALWFLHRDGRPWLGDDVAASMRFLLFLGVGFIATRVCDSFRRTDRQKSFDESKSASKGMMSSSIRDDQFRRLVEGVRDYAILMLDSQGRVRVWPPAAAEMTGYQSDQILDRPFSSVFQDDGHLENQPKELLKLASNHGQSELEVACVRKDGEPFWADVSVAALRGHEGELVGFSVVMRDIQEREDAHQQRAQELAEANRLKDEFLATVSHELRTPLNSILGWAQLLRSGKLDESGCNHALETIEQSAKTQARLIEDLLDVSRIITGKMRLDVRTIELAQVVESAIETVRPAADAKGIEIQTFFASTSAVVYGDPSRLQQIVWNLLSNAIKFTPRGGTVRVRLNQPNSHVSLSVEDTGVGIKPMFLPYVFDAFRQADSSSTRSHKGLGLGLAIVRRLVELHGGSVKAESPGEGQGTTFRVLLPVASVQFASRPSYSSRSAPGRLTLEELSSVLQDLRVIVVDDDRGARELLSMALVKYGIQVTSASSAAEGLAAVQQLRPDVLLSDIEMPDEDGYTFIRKVRALCPEEGGDTPAVAVTAYARPEDRRRTLQAGFQIHLTKPIESDELASAIAVLADQRLKGIADVQAVGHRR